MARYLHVQALYCRIVKKKMSSSNSTEIKETLNVLHEMSNILDTGLDKETLSILVSLTEKGINPEALATVVEELRREALANKGKEKP